MPELLTMQGLANGHLDVKALGEAANGDENTIVTTRTGNTYPSAERAINIMFQNGGLPAKPFPTLAKMQTEGAALADGQLAQVYNETANNGLYVKTAGNWVKSAYDPVEQANVYTDSVAISTLDTASQVTNDSIDIAVEEVVRNQEKTVSSSVDGARLFVFVDDSGKVVEYTDSNGGKHLTDMEGSLQSNIHKVKKVFDSVNTNPTSAVTHIFSDANDRVLAYIRQDGGLVIQGLDAAVQDKINTLEATVTDLTSILYSNSVAKVPERVKGDFSVDTADLLNLVVSTPYKLIDMDSPYRKNDNFIHPDVMSLSEPIRGYNYLMCNTPYKDYNVDEENPVIYGSKDRINWEMLTGFEQPLDNPPQVDEPWSGRDGYLSDNWLSYDPIKKEILLCYRKNYYADRSLGYQPTDTTELLYRKTTNLLHWSEPTKLIKTVAVSVDDYVSPNMIYDKVNNRWVLFTSGRVRFNPTLDPDTWSERQSMGISEFTGLAAWHYGIGFVGDKLVMILGDSSGSSTGGQKTYRLAVSNDDTFLNWSFTLNSVFGTTWNGAYKGSFLVIPVDDAHIKLQFFVAGGNPGKVRTLTSDAINITQNGAV